MRKNEEFLALLVKKKIISQVKADELKKNISSEQSLEGLLLRERILDSEKLVELKAEHYHLPYKNLQNEAIKDDALNFISKDIARNYSLVCFYRDPEIVKIGLVHFDFKAVEAVNFLARGLKIKTEYYLISDKSYREVFKKYEKMEEEISTALEAKAKTEGEELIQVKEETSEVLSEEDVNSAPIAKIVSVIIKHAVESRASDIHVEPYDKECRVRYRIDGILHNSLMLPRAVHNSVVARIKVLAKLKLDETRIPQDGHIRLIVDAREIDFRVSTLPLYNAEKVEMRILDQAKGVTVLEDLGFNKHCYEIVKDNIRRKSGIMLLTGPTGSGKTTTLYSLLNILNKEVVNISTLEDPIEYQIKGVNQSQVRPELNFDFATGLRSLLRQDPNIIMVGEIRDDETTELAIHAGLTGHLVLSTLHTNDALGAIFRLLDMKVEPFLLASTLRVIVAQRLVRRLCKHCKKEVALSEDAMNRVLNGIKDLPEEVIKKEVEGINNLEDIKKLKFYEPVGCVRCANTGYMERIALAEVVIINEEIQEMIINRRADLSLDSIKTTQPFISLKQDGIFKILNGVTNLTEVLRVIEIENL